VGRCGHLARWSPSQGSPELRNLCRGPGRDSRANKDVQTWHEPRGPARLLC
jgi:hypothetical protein